ncbi:MAG: magnesium and cobalt transport protein CorA, partial [Proteobacteria bacterium]|nr:magnesium and cobalt transport protein CorA [Pseudomonadota bacterium]
MAHFLSDESKMVGLPPGTIVHIGEASDEAVRFTVFAY